MSNQKLVQHMNVNAADLLIEVRKNSGMSRQQVADVLKANGEEANDSSIGKAERGEGPGTIGKLRRILDAMGYDLEFRAVPKAKAVSAKSSASEEKPAPRSTRQAAGGAHAQ